MNLVLVPEFDGLTVIYCRTEVQSDSQVLLKSRRSANAPYSSFEPGGGLIRVARRVVRTVATKPCESAE